MRRLATVLLALPLAAQAPVTVNVKDVSMKLGLLAQPMVESAGTADSRLEGTSQNLFLRRFRILFGGAIGDDFEFFFETDNSNLGKHPNRTSANPILQDAVLTYKASKNVRIDAGLLLVPGAHHGTQGPTTLLAADYGSYTFQQSAALDNGGGRDTGVMVRGLAGKLEYRVGAFQGRRAPATPTGVASRNAFRFAGRAQFNLFDAENGLFLAGTYLGKKKILSFGVSHDRQDDYQSTGVDAFLDWPLGNDTLTAQVNHVVWDGGDWVGKLTTNALRKQKTTFAEASYRFGRTQLAPYVRFEQRTMDVPNAAVPDEQRVGAGLSWWFKGHTSNLKLYVQNISPEAPGATTLRSYTQANLQWQLFFF